MGMLHSQNEKISAVRFDELGSRPLKNIKAIVHIDRRTYALHENGKIYTDSHVGGRCCQVNTDHKDSSVRALVALGIITKWEAVKHGERKRIREKVQDIVTEAFHDAKYLKMIGVELTPAQKTRISNLRRRVKADDIPYWLGEKAKETFEAKKAKVQE